MDHMGWGVLVTSVGFSLNAPYRVMSQRSSAMSGLIANPAVVGGIPLPSSTAPFLAIVAVHVSAGLVCVVAAPSPCSAGNSLGATH